MATTKRSSSRLTPTQARAARRARRTRRRRLYRVGALSIIGVIAAAFIVSLFLPGLPIGVGGGHGGGGTPDGPGERIADAGRIHVVPGQVHDEYTSIPATSGPHYGQPLGPVAWGIYEEPLIPEQYVHNFEHGGAGVFYDCPEGCPELVAQLEEVVNEGLSDNLEILMAPHPDMDRRISLAAWTFLDQFDEFDEQRIRNFVSTHHNSGNAPEWQAR